MKRTASIFFSFLFVFSTIFSQDNVFDQIKWKFQTGDRIYSSPVVVNGVICFGSNDDFLYAVNSSDGSEAWKFKTDGDVRSGITYSDRALFFGSTDGFYYAVNISDGTLLWKFKTNGETEEDVWDYYMSTPLVHNNNVLFGSGDSSFYCLDKNTGNLKWFFKTKGIIHSSPAVKNETVCFGSFDGYFYALDINTGEEKWKFNTLGNEFFPKGAIQGSPTIYDNSVYFGSRDYNLYVLDVETGAVMWNNRSPSWIIAKPIVDTAKVVYYGNSDNPHLFAKHAVNGSDIWEFKVSANVFSTAVLFDDQVLFGSFNGKVYVMNKVSGELDYIIQTDASKKNYSTIFNEDDEIKEDILSNLKTIDDFIKVYDNLLALGSIIGTPVIENNVLYIPSTDGCLYAFE